MTKPATIFDRLLSGQRTTGPTLLAQAQLHPGARIEPHFSLPVPELSELGAMIDALLTPAKPAAPGAPMQTLLKIVLDESGSMQTGYEQTIKGYNEQMAAARSNASQIGCLVSQINFNHTNQVLAIDVTAEKIVPLSGETYMPSGGTALYDTVAAVIKSVLAQPMAHDDNTSILLAITTDGDDTSSTVWRTSELAELSALMAAISKNDRWTVALAGPNLKLAQFAKVMCVDRENVAAFEPESVASRFTATASSTMAMASYVRQRTSGAKRSSDMYAGTAAGILGTAIVDADAAKVDFTKNQVHESPKG